MTAPLDPATADRLVKLCGMLGSAHDGERAAAAMKADALVRTLGLSWRDVISPPLAPVSPEQEMHWQTAAAYCFSRRDELRPKERQFIETLQSWRGLPTPKQLRWLNDITNRLQGCAQ